ncbi:hypothetical protein [Streptomyces sp. NPDC001380]|uniref:hypothetical protein n=1 Tax=Streptomyces sp. NPDC001380 TaxID=3364566 RepID=UPI0036A97658
MNLRSLKRGDAAVAVGALLLLVSSFLPLYSAAKKNCTGDTCSYNTWHSGFLVTLGSVVLAGLAGAALVLLARSRGEAAQAKQVAGLRLGQWGTALTVFAAWSAVWTLFANGSGYFAALPSSDGVDFGDSVDHAFGTYLMLLAALVTAGAAVATPLVPALQARLLPDARPAPAPQQGGAYPGGYPGGPQQGYPQQGGYPGGPQQGGAYPGGYPGGPQQGGPGGYPGGPQQGGHPGHPQQGGHPGGPGQDGGYGYPAAQQPAGGQPWGGAAQQPGPGGQQPQEGSFGGPAGAHAPAPAPAPAPDFAPFWFAVPAPRPLAPEDDPAGPPVGELTPGTWFLAVEQRGPALVAQLQDGRRGLLTDTSGIERG